MPSALPPVPWARWRPLRAASAAAAVLYALAVAVATLTPQPVSREEPAFGALCVVCGELGGADLVANTLFFIPLGMALTLAGVRARRVALALGAASLAIEIAQYALVPGRYATLSDVLTNSAGGALGALLAARGPWTLLPTPLAARRLAAGAALVWLGVLGASAWALERAPGPGYPRPVRGVLSVVPGSGWFPGHVRAATLDGIAVGGGPPAGPVIVGAAAGRDFAMTATLDGCDAAGRSVVFYLVHDARRRPQAVLTQEGRDVSFAARLRARGLRLRRPNVELSQVFPPATRRGHGTEATCTGVTRVAGASRGHTLTITAVDHAGRRHERRLTLTPTVGWSLLLPFVSADGRLAPPTTALWLAALIAPFGYWARWAARAARPRWAWPVMTAVVLAMGLAGVPVVAGYPVATWWEWGAALAGAAAGAALAAWLARRPWARPTSPRPS